MLEITPIADSPASALDIATGFSPYLKNLRDTCCHDGHDPQALYRFGLEQCHWQAVDTPATMTRLRQAKRAVHLAIAMLDLSGCDDLPQVMRRMSDFADMAVKTAFAEASGAANLPQTGLFLAALGKMGAFELNYSSDIDVAAFVDTRVFDDSGRDQVDIASRIVHEAMRILNERTVEGYVFRTDLRLRPDPGSTPLAVPVVQAEIYYESIGQNWERMAWIKGRPVAGDPGTGQRFMRMIEPFVWRRHLDYWVIDDVHAIKHMIDAQADGACLNNSAPDVKLDSGGIREIEFFVQTQQIILGGRNPSLRFPGTLDALGTLADLGMITPSTAHDMGAAYRALRGVEHRIQMLNDEQTHTVPDDPALRAAVAALCGYSQLAAFDAAICETRSLVRSHYSRLFADKRPRYAGSGRGNLVFTGVDDDPGTLATLVSMGFLTPSRIIGTIRKWHYGRIPATRTTRGREQLTALLPDLLRAMAKTGEANEAFRQFSRFFEGLRSGVQTLSMLGAEPGLMDDLVTTLALAPYMADTLAKRPGLLEALLNIPDRKQAPHIRPDTDFETAMNDMRHWHGERFFLIGHRLLHARLEPEAAAAKWSMLAETCLCVMVAMAERETVRRFGPPPGPWSIAALGRLGGLEMTAGSDLDLLVVYDCEKPDAQTWFTRFTQRLITALSADTPEGRLYDVDMRLRPSGRSGPVATSIAAFEHYQMHDAWTFEHMALTRLRPVAGDEALGQHVNAIADRAIANGDRQRRRQDILEMRQRLHDEKPSRGAWDLKMRPGGLVDLEFIIQHAWLTQPGLHPHVPVLGCALAQIAHNDCLDKDTHALLHDALRFLQALYQVKCVTHGAKSAEWGTVSPGLAERLCRVTGCESADALEQKLESVCAAVSRLFRKRIGDAASTLQGPCLGNKVTP